MEVTSWYFLDLYKIYFKGVPTDEWNQLSTKNGIGSQEER
jgi:hypothetical protein